MTKKVTELDEHRPHYSGPAECSSCRYSWVAVAQTKDDLECPNCGNMAGEYVDGQIRPAKDEYRTQVVDRLVQRVEELCDDRGEEGTLRSTQLTALAEYMADEFYEIKLMIKSLSESTPGPTFL